MSFIDQLREMPGEKHQITRNLIDSQNPWPAKARVEIDGMWDAFSDLADSGFIAKFARNPEDHFWEMYLGASLRDMGLKLTSADVGPDLLATTSEGRIWIEAIAPGPGNPSNPDAVPEIVYGKAEAAPRDRMILRLTGAAESKRQSFLAYEADGIVTNVDRCVIAVSGGNITSRPFSDRLPYIVQAVYPIGHMYVTLDASTLQKTGEGRVYEPQILKSGDRLIPKTAFLSEEYALISGLIFCKNGIANTTARWGEDFILVHNYAATRPLPRGWLTRGVEYWLEEDGQDYVLQSHDHNNTEA